MQYSREKGEIIGILTLCLAAFALLSFAFLGQNVHVLGDEYTYSLDSQWTAAAQSTYPVWLYLNLFSIVRWFGADFYQAARLLNAVIFVLSIPFIYGTARLYASPAWALIIAALSAFAPISAYVAFYMPDTMFYTSFWVLAWFTLTQRQIRPGVYGSAIGAICGAATLVKPHGMFVFAAVMVSIGAELLFDRKRSTVDKIAIVITTGVVGFFAIRFGLGFAFAGRAGLSLVGAYSQWVSSSWTPEKIQAAVDLGALLISTHTVAIAVWGGAGVVSLSFLLLSVDQNHRALALFTLCVGGLMLAISVVFSVRIADGAPALDALRVHMRYYNFLFPALLIAGAASASVMPKHNWVVYAVAIIVAGCALASVSSFILPRAVTHVDAPELRGLIANGSWFPVAGVLMAACSALLAYMPKIGGRLYIFCVMPLAVTITTPTVFGDLRVRMIDLPSDKAGVFARQTLGLEAANTTIVGDGWSMLNTRFILNVPGPGDIGTPESFGIDPPTIPATAQWLLILDRRDRPAGWEAVWNDQSGWSLLKRQASGT